MIKPLLILNFLLWVSVLKATPIIVLDGSLEDIVVSSQFIEIFEDTSQTLHIWDISKSEFQSRYYVSKKRLSYVREIGTNYWLKIKVKYAQSNTKHWVLEYLDLHTGQVLVYIQTRRELKVLGRSGSKVPFDQRTYQHKNLVFDLPRVLQNEEFTIYIRVNSENYNPFLFKFRTYNYFMYYALNEYAVLGMYYGILLIMAIYNLLLYLYVRENLYLYYVVYVFSCIWVSFAEDGLGYQYLWRDYPFFNALLDNFSHYVFLLCFTLYTQTFLEFRKYVPRLNNTLGIILWLYAFYFVLSFGLAFDSPKRHFILLLIPFVLIYVGTFQIYLQDKKSISRFFLIGYTLTMLGIISTVFRKVGISYDNIFFVYSLNMGLVVEIILFSLAMAYRLRIIKLEKEKSQDKFIKDLQKIKRIITRKVLERTEEIARQKDEIEEKNHELAQQAKTLKQQADEINRMNQILNQENENLQSSMKELSKARVLMKEVNFTEFSNIFPDDEACYQYLTDLKWKNGYICTKCGNDRYLDGQGHFARRCSKCGYNESCTVHTIFHRTHIPIHKAFYLLFLVYANQNKITVAELSYILALRENTCGKFKKKINDKIKQINNSIIPRNTDGWSELILD